MKLALRAPNWIGDCVMCLPAVRALKSNFPDLSISLVSKAYLQDIYRGMPEIDEIIPIPDTLDWKTTFKTARQLQQYHFDAGLLFTNSFHSAFLFKLAHIPDICGYNKDLRGFLLKHKLPFLAPGQKHHVDFYLDLVHFFTTRKQKIPLLQNFPIDLMIAAAEKEQILLKLAELGVMGVKGGGKMIGISPAAAYGTAKQWRPERFGELWQRLLLEIDGCEILLFGSGKEREAIAKIIETGKIKSERVHNLAGRLGLREAMAAISLCHVFISNDSGLMHVAAALGVPLAAIFGPTRPHHTSPRPARNQEIIILHQPVACAPCNHRDCPTDHACMKAVAVVDAAHAVKKLLQVGSNHE